MCGICSTGSATCGSVLGQIPPDGVHHRRLADDRTLPGRAGLHQLIDSEEAEQEFHRTALFAAGYHPEYFGEYPVPIRTPRGYTLRLNL